MKVGKKILIGSIILLLMTTPLVATARKNEINKPPSMNVYETYSLGQVNITHQPLLFNSKGMDVEYCPNKLYWSNNSYYFNFTEVNGSVYLNFTLAIKHRLNQVPIPYFAKFIFPNRYRYTWVNLLWINQPGGDIYSIENKSNCNSPDWKYCNITLTGKTLNTSGKDKNLKFELNGAPGITPIPIIQTLIALILKLNVNWLEPWCNPYPYIKIIIHPI